MIAIFEAYKSGLLRFQNWPSNFIAGVIVGIIALPLAMAFAIAILGAIESLLSAVIADGMMGTPHIREELRKAKLGVLPTDVMIYNIQGPFFFGAVEILEHALATTHTDPKYLIFRLKNVPFMDITGLQTFQEVIEQLHRRKVSVILCEANPIVSRKLKRLGIFKCIHENHIFPTLSLALSHMA